ncbi:MAG: hypothetical protein Q9214_001058 [Letrouitia sp. 1 TL-2023]
MDFYQVNLLAFVLLNGSMVYRQYKKEKAAEISEKLLDCDTESLIGDANIPQTDSATAFTKTFFPVYVLVWAADWLQGPFIYTLYKDEKQLPEEIVARLFTTGFLAGAVSALFVGSLADRFGRRAACMLYCVITISSCVTVLSDNTSILFFGRALGGLGTTLMYTVFEAWMVAEYNRRGLERTSLKLSTIFGRMTTLSSVVAVLSGLVGQGLVSYTKTNCAPFIASVCCLVPAALFIWIKWTENFGDNETSHKTGSSLRLLLGG